MSSAQGLQAPILFVLVGIGLVYYSLRRQRRVQQVQDTARSKIASAPQGFVEVEGFAWPMKEGPKNSQGFETIYYSFQLQRQETRGHGKNKKKVWVTVCQHVHGGPFYVVDATGAAIVDIASASFDISRSKISSWHRLSREAREYFLANFIKGSYPGFPPTGWLRRMFSSNYRVVENDILVGSPIHLSGDFKSDASKEEKARELGLSAFRKRVFNLEARSLKNADVILDKNKDGKVSELEARSGYCLVAKTAREMARANSQAEDEVLVHGHFRKSENHPLHLADVHEQHLVGRLNRFNRLMTVGGSLMIALGMMGGMTVVFPNYFEAHQNVSTRFLSTIKRVDFASVSAEVLHDECGRGRAEACRSLLNRKDEFKLPQKYVDVYSKRACESGAKEFCR